MKIYFLTLEEVLEIHSDQLQRYGGGPGIRDQGLLISALAQPSSSFQGQYLHSSLFHMAAAYLFHIVKNHPFIDGNKRTGVVSSLMFLALNEIEIELSEDEMEKMVLDVASSKMEKDALCHWFEQHVQT